MKNPRSHAGILLAVVIISALPALLAYTLEYLSANRRIHRLIESVTIETAIGLSIANHIVDQQVINAMSDIRQDFTDSPLSPHEWSKMLRQRADNEYLYSDILIVESDGQVLASGRLDSPRSVSGIMRSIGYTSDRVVRGEAYNERPYGKYLLPYVTGIEKDEDGNYKYALVILVNSEVYTDAASAMNVGDEMDICMLDRAGRIFFRFPPPGEQSRLAKGKRIPLEDWNSIRSGGERGNLTITGESGKTYYSGYVKLSDNTSEPYGYIVVSMNEKNLHRRNAHRDMFAIISITLFAALLLMSLAYRIGYTKLVAPKHPGAPSGNAGGASPDGGAGIMLDEDRDFVTGASNRRAGLAQMSELRSKAVGSGSPFSIIIVDIDGFKQVNELFGNRTGDDVLRRIGRLLASSIRPHDILCRYGGDEFLVVLHDTSDENAKSLWKRIEESHENTPPEGLPDVLLSRGIASFDPKYPVGNDELITRALNNLKYSRKKKGA